MKIPWGKLGVVAGILLAVSTMWSVAGMRVHTEPMARQMEAVGYAVNEMRDPACFDRIFGGYVCLGTIRPTTFNYDNNDVVELTYQPAGSPDHCGYRIEQRAPTPIGNSGWIFQLDRRSNDRPLGAKDHKATDGWSRDYATAKDPSPAELWEFVNKYLDGVDPKCKPTGVKMTS